MIGPRLVLEHLDFRSVLLHVELADGTSRPVRVLVGSGHSWREAVRFPHLDGDLGATLGDPELDEAVRVRAAEELARLDGAVRAIRERAA